MVVDVRAEVIGNTRLSGDYNVLTLAAPELAAQALSGQFVMVQPAEGCAPFLRRPFSIFEVWSQNGGIRGFSLLNKRVGIGTSRLFAAEPGQHVACLGPLGRPFETLEARGDVWMVAGGVGLAPFLTLAESLEPHQPATLFYGARDASELFYLDRFAQRHVRIELATEDGSRGTRGPVTIPLERALQQALGSTPSLYACGPTPMLRAVAGLAAHYGASCQVSVEQVMGCGLGGCYSCVVPIRRGSEPARYVRSCIEGPVFRSDELDWNRLIHG